MTSISLVGMSGEIEVLDLSRGESVRDVRQRLAKMFKSVAKNVELYYGSHKMADEFSVVEAVRQVDHDSGFHERESLIAITVINIACDYKKHLVDYRDPGYHHSSYLPIHSCRYDTYNPLALIADPGYRSYPFRFPKPKDIIINMMPFIIGDPRSVPREYHQYLLQLEGSSIAVGRKLDLMNPPPCRERNVGYLTIQERLVKKGESLCHPGLRIESYWQWSAVVVSTWLGVWLACVRFGMLKFVLLEMWLDLLVTSSTSEITSVLESPWMRVGSIGSRTPHPKSI